MSGDTVVFESWRGKYSDSPRAVSERLGEVMPELRRIWVVSGPEVELPDDVERVIRNTPAYFLRIASARYFFSNDMMPRYPLKTSRTTYVQLWHGTPLKRIGFDVPDAHYDGADLYARRLAKDVKRWDHVVSPNRFSTEKFRQAFRYDGSVLEVGYPRNDVLSGPNAQDLREKTRAELGLDPSTRAVLYTPTWRDDALTGTAKPTRWWPRSSRCSPVCPRTPCCSSASTPWSRRPHRCRVIPASATSAVIPTSRRSTWPRI